MSQIVRKPNILEELAKRESEFTPDWFDLQMNHPRLMPLFVYGTLRSGGRYNNILDGCPTLGEARTCVCYKMMATEEYPVVFRGDKTFRINTLNHVIGEVYLVDILTLKDIDALEGNNWIFNRSEHFVYLLDEEQQYKTTGGMTRPSMKCWMYFGDLKELGGTENLEEVNCTRKISNGYLTVYDWDASKPSSNIQKSHPFDDEVPNFLKNSS